MTTRRPTKTTTPLVWHRNAAVFSRTFGKEWTALLGNSDLELRRWRLKIYYPPLTPIRTMTKRGVVSRPPKRRERLRPEPLRIQFLLYFNEQVIETFSSDYGFRRPRIEEVRTECVRWASLVFRKLASKMRQLKA